MVDIAERIKIARKRHNVTAQEISAKLGIAQSTLSQWERSIRKPSLEYVEYLCAELGADPVWLVLGKEPEAAKPKTEESTVEKELIADYRELSDDKQELYRYRIKADALEAKMKKRGD